MKRRQHGFTLIEIAIVLVIIGLLLGGVLKGQELINQAKIKKVNNDFESMAALVYAYQDRYKRLPGDDGQAGTRWTGTSSGSGDNRIDGNFDAAAAAEGGTTAESRLFWQHMRLAGFIAGDTASSVQGTNAVGGILGVQTDAGSAGTGSTVLPGLVFCSSNLTGKFAIAVDAQFDDGVPNTGSVRGFTGGAAAATARGASSTAYTDDNVVLYTVCRSLN